MELFPISTDFHKLVYEKLFSDKNFMPGGAYRLIAVEDGKRVAVGRFLGTDPDGILYIGKGNSYLDRVVNLKKTLSPEHRNLSHSGGVRYKSNLGISERFSFDKLFIELHPHENPLQKEKELLKEYFEIYGEVPPLNSQEPRNEIEILKLNRR